MEWRTCPQWPEYEVSERGDIRRTLCRFGNIGLRKPYRAANGRLMIAMRHCGKTRACHISRLVLEAFVGPAPSSKHQCAHNDGNPDNNHWSNLRWATASENQMDRVAHGTSNRGERFGRVRLTQPQALEAKRALACGTHPAIIAAQYDVAVTTIKSIKQGRSWAWLQEEA
ncbi:HNH endonuclease signature motif containing protein [Cupriavidus metallidurans]|uniref:HNH endonuclease signature motif containing protein n=1 Tax=Cupriavidus metallidurans TaxID=119219 RepID=UPI0035C77A58